MHRRKELVGRIRPIPCSCFVIETLKSKSVWVIHSLSDLRLCYIRGYTFGFMPTLYSGSELVFILLCCFPSTGILGELTYLLCQHWAQLPEPSSPGLL